MVLEKWNLAYMIAVDGEHNGTGFVQKSNTIAAHSIFCNERIPFDKVYNQSTVILLAIKLILH